MKWGNFIKFLNSNKEYLNDNDLNTIISIVQTKVNKVSLDNKKSKETKLNGNSNPFGKKLICYTDGSYNESTNLTGGGVIYFEEGDEKNYKEATMNMTDFYGSRNVTGETQAVILAIKKAVKLGYKNIDIVYDYTGIEKWVKGEWKAKKPIAKDYLEEYSDLVNIFGLNVEFCKVKGHSGEKFNELVDKLVKKEVGIL